MRTAGRIGEAHFSRTLFEQLEVLRTDKALDRQMVPGRLEILPEGQHVDGVCAHLAHDFKDFLVGLAQPQHQAGLGGNAGIARLEVQQQFERMRIVRAGPAGLVQARHGFQVVVHHIGQTLTQDVQSNFGPTAKVRRQDLDPRRRRGLTHRTDAVDKMLGAAVAQIVAIHAGDHHVLELERLDRIRQMARLFGIGRVLACRDPRRRMGSAGYTNRPGS